MKEDDGPCVYICAYVCVCVCVNGKDFFSRRSTYRGVPLRDPQG